MTLNEYQTITGITVSSSDQTRVTAQIARTQLMLETILGYTLNPTLADDNQYIEIGKTSLECPCPNVDVDNLEDPDAVVGAYRLFNYNRRERIISIDPASEIHAVKLVKDGVTFKTFDTDDYRAHYENGIIRYIEECDNCCWCTCVDDCYCTQLAVDADWLWATGDTIPSDLLQVWAEMATYYSDIKGNIKSETLGPHSYTKFDKVPPHEESYSMSVLRKYMGAHGSGRRIITV